MVKLQGIDLSFPAGLIICLVLVLVNISYGRQPKLKDVFKSSFLIGTALTDGQINGKDIKAVTRMREHFNSITAENVMKWGIIHPKPDAYDFELADRFVALGEKDDLFLVGHTLVWHAQTPDWVFQDESGISVTREVLLERMKNHIIAVVGRYKGSVQGWDVVNEAIKDDGQMRKSKWFEIIGEDYVQKAFEYAHEADPDAELYYNDYSLYFPAKRNSTIRLLRNLLSKGVRVNGIGLQGHWVLDCPEKLADIEDTILTFSQLGVKVMVTELDVSVLPFPEKQKGADVTLSLEWQERYNPYSDVLPDSIQKRLADRYSELFQLFDRHKDKISRITIWGIHDGQSWRNYWPVRGRTDYPLLFDREYQSKPAYKAVIDIVND